jgi:septal ring factor EnvC (AmiA/AmiB activator)
MLLHFKTLSKSNLRILVLLCIATFSMQFSWAQSNKKTQLQKQYKQIQEEIKKIVTLIATTQTEKTNSLNQLQSIESRINTRLNLIDNIHSQIEYLKQSLIEKQNVINALKKDIERLKEDYAKMILNIYQTKYSTNPINFLFSAESFNQAIQRFAYLRTYAKTRENQSKLINQTIEDLNVKIQKLEAEKAEKEAFLKEEVSQRAILETERSQKNQLITKLQGDEANFKKQIDAKNKAAKDLNNQIQKIIEDEIKLAMEKAKKAAIAKGEKPSVGLALTPDEKQLSKDFINNLGKLPWPVTKGFIVSKFGKHEHESLKNVYTNNNGIDIKTEAGTDVRAVFSGTVVNSFYLPATQNSVIVKHGEYFSVYSNLKSVSVKAGEKIATKQSIGLAYTQDDLTKVHLEIWKGMEKTNPELWLSK